jgi:hypothetical protein
VAHWAKSVEVLLPRTSADRPLAVLPLLAEILGALAPDAAMLSVKLDAPEAAPAPTAPFIAISHLPPAGAAPRVRFDRGRVAVADRGGQTLLDVGGFTAGAVAQLVNVGSLSGVWIKPLADDGTLPTPAELKLDRGDAAFVDNAGVALALSTVRDRLVRVTYPDQVSWLTIADRFRPWLVGGFWLVATIGFLFLLQRILRRRPLSD